MSKGQNVSPNNIHGLQVLHNCDHGINFHPAACTGYGTVAFWTLIPQFHQSRSYNVGVNCTFLAHLSQRLIGELKVYWSSRHFILVGNDDMHESLDEF